MVANATILYDDKEYGHARAAFEELSRTAKNENVRHDCLFNVASCLASEGDFIRALEILNEENTTKGADSQDLLYNRALCNYKLSKYKIALKQINQLLSNCHEKYPELSIITRNLMPLVTQDEKQNRLLLESCIVEGVNLKSAILYKLNQDSRESLSCLNELPFDPNNFEQLDCVTLHNQAIYESDINLHLCISKLTHLVELTTGALQEQDFAVLVPPETFRNLILVYISNGLLEVATKFMSTNENLIRKYVAKDLRHFFDIHLEQSINPNELICRKLNIFLDQLLAKMREIDNNKQAEKNTNVLSHEVDLIELATTVATQECLILWNTGQYQTLEKLLDKISSSLPDSSDVWLKNKAHNLFMMDTRFSDSANLYEKFLPQSATENLINVDPMVLGNLCVSYVLTGRNGEAEALMKDVEIDETTAMGIINETDATTISFTGQRQATAGSRDVTARYGSCLSHINMVIGTLYCVKLNYEFGLSRMFKSLVPMEQKLNLKSWFYVKRCILSLLDCHCKQMICIKDDLLQQVVSFLIQCEEHGLLSETYKITTKTLTDSDDLLGQEPIQPFHGRNSVTYEARYIRSIVLTVIHD